jgi:hypothetical protein
MVNNTQILTAILGVVSALSISGGFNGLASSSASNFGDGMSAEDKAYDKKWQKFIKQGSAIQLVAGILVAIAAWLAYSGKSGYVAVTLGAVFALGGINGLIAPPHPLEATQDPNYRG